jgi:hypothetical protein
VVAVVELQEFFASELSAIVCYDGVGYPEAVHDVREEKHHLLRPKAADGVDLDPLREFIDGYEYVGEAPEHLSQGADYI